MRAAATGRLGRYARERHHAGIIRRSGVFDEAQYLRRNPDVAAAGIDPVLHYLRHGATEGRRAHPFFAEDWYLRQNPDVVAAEVHPLVHFLTYGIAEGRNPSPGVDLSDYLARHPFCESHGLNPLVHLALTRPSPPSTVEHKPVRRTDSAPSRGGRRLAFECVKRPDVSVIIPVYNDLKHTTACLASLASSAQDCRFEVIVIDDASPDVDTSELAGIPNLRYLRNAHNVGFTRTCNRGAEVAQGRFLLFLNNDTIVADHCLGRLMRTFAEFPDAGLVGGKLVFPDGRLQEAGGIVWQDGSASNYGRGQSPDDPRYNYVRAVDYCSGALLMIERDFFREMGGFDTHFDPAYYEDTDLAFRVRRTGRRVYYQPTARVTHVEGASCGTDTSAGVKRHQVLNHRKFVDRWRESLRRHQPRGESPEEEKERDVTRRLLVIDHAVPAPNEDSGSLRMAHILRIVRDLGWKVSFVPANLHRREPQTAELQAQGIEVIHEPFYSSVEEFLNERGETFDAVVLSRLAPAEQNFEAVRRHCLRAQVVFDTVDLHFLRHLREAQLSGDEAALRAAEEMRQRELELIRAADVTLVVSPVEQTLLKELAPEADVRIVSNIHEVRATTAPFETRRDLLFIGYFAHRPNVDAMLWFCLDVLGLVRRELPDVVLRVVGGGVPPEIRSLHSDHVQVMGFVPDVDPLFASCRLTVAPLRYGAGVKGKVNQSMAHGVPCVGTTVAVEGMGLTHGLDVMIADDAAGFARAVVEVYRDADLWQRLSDGGRRNVEHRFSVALARRELSRILSPESLAFRHRESGDQHREHRSHEVLDRSATSPLVAGQAP